MISFGIKLQLFIGNKNYSYVIVNFRTSCAKNTFT